MGFFLQTRGTFLGECEIGFVINITWILHLQQNDKSDKGSFPIGQHRMKTNKVCPESWNESKVPTSTLS